MELVKKDYRSLQLLDSREIGQVGMPLLHCVA